MLWYARDSLQQVWKGHRRRLLAEASVDKGLPLVYQPLSKPPDRYTRTFMGGRFKSEPYLRERIACPRPDVTLPNGLSAAAVRDLPWPRDQDRIHPAVLIRGVTAQQKVPSSGQGGARW